MALTWAENNGKRVGQEIVEFDDNEASLSALDGLFSSFWIMPQSTGI
jgi:hypothetical protein